MITTSASANVVLYESSAVTNVIKYFEPDIRVEATMIDENQAVCNLVALDSDGNPMGQQTVVLRSSELNAEIMAGSTNAEKMYSIFELAAVTYLESLSGNTGITFTIS